MITDRENRLKRGKLEELKLKYKFEACKIIADAESEQRFLTEKENKQLTKFEEKMQECDNKLWALKYHAERIEELDLPMWEEWQGANKTGMYAMSFRDKKYHYCELMVFYDEIKVTKQAYGLEVLFDEPNTEENYEKACDVALKLFMGEENERE